MKRFLFSSVPFAGHTNQLIVLASEMVKRGYEVHFAAGNAFRRQIEDQKIIYIEWDQERLLADGLLIGQFQSVWDIASRETDIIRGEKIIHSVLIETYSVMYKAMRAIFKDLNPDVVVSDSAAMPTIDIAIQMNKPNIILAQFLGNHVRADAKYPQFGTSFLMQMNFLERILNRLHPLRTLLHLYGPFSRLVRYRKECSVEFTLREVFNRSLMLAATSFGVEIPRTLPPNVKMVGPLISKERPTNLEKLRDWLQVKPQAPVIYMSFGTLASIEAWQARTLVNAFSDQKYKVLWSLRKAQREILPILPPNIRVEEHVDQIGVLSHPSVKAFISHCGMNSVSESLHYAKPILALPIFGDQHYNAARLVDLGVAMRLDKNNFNSVEVRSKIETILNDREIHNRLSIISENQHRSDGLNYAASLLESAANDSKAVTSDAPISNAGTSVH